MLSRYDLWMMLLVAVVVSCLCLSHVEARGVTLLKDIYDGKFFIGFAARQNYWMDEPMLEHFNSVTAENIMKWDSLQPSPGVFRFARADNLVKYAENNGMSVVGHTLIWHNQTPNWVFLDDEGNDVSRDELLRRMETHIKTVMGHYKGRVKAWDVVNEAIEQNPTTGKWELRDSKWRQIIGDDFIEHAFRFAHEADPDAELYYNDYNAADGPKRDAIYALVKSLLDKGLRVDAVGMQGHWDLQNPSLDAIREAFELYASLGLKVHVTELDVSLFTWNNNTNPYVDGLPDAIANQQANRYAALFRLFNEYEGTLGRVTFWGVRDNYSWKNDFPVRGRRDYPLLFDANGDPKPAFWAIINPYKPWEENRDK